MGQGESSLEKALKIARTGLEFYAELLENLRIDWENKVILERSDLLPKDMDLGAVARSTLERIDTCLKRK